MSDVFPAPVAPIIPTFWPGLILKLIFLSICSPSILYDTFLNSTLPSGFFTFSSTGPVTGFFISGSTSIVAYIFSTDVVKRCQSFTSQPAIRRGASSIHRYPLIIAIFPRVICPFITIRPPASISTKVRRLARSSNIGTWRTHIFDAASSESLYSVFSVSNFEIS